MSLLRISALSFLVLVMSACTTTPAASKKEPSLFTQSSVPVQLPTGSAKAQSVASAGIGVPQVYTDPKTGTSTEITVQREYFSANGRLCRRYSEKTDGRDIAGVSCQDDDIGWTEIPLSTFVQ